MSGVSFQQKKIEDRSTEQSAAPQEEPNAQSKPQSDDMSSIRFPKQPFQEDVGREGAEEGSSINLIRRINLSNRISLTLVSMCRMKMAKLGR